MYGTELNVVEIGDGTFAVKKELLSPYFYTFYPQCKDPLSTVEVQGIKFIILPPDAILAKLDELMEPHEMDEYDYPYAGGVYGNYYTKQPYPHQIYTTRAIIREWGKTNGMHVHNSMGTGKTMSCLWGMDYLFKVQKIKKVLIVSPRSVMRAVWLQTIVEEMPWVTVAIKQNKTRGRVTDAMVDIINHDGITAELIKHREKIGKRTFFHFEKYLERYDLIIYDEATALKNVSTDRWMAFNRWLEYLRSRYGTKIWLLTGTPIAQSPLDAYGLIKLIAPDTVPHHIKQWRAQTMYCVSELAHKWEVQEGAIELCAQKLQPSVRFDLKDCTDLPDHQFIFVPVEKNNVQKKLFKEMSNSYIATLDDDTRIQASNGAAKLSKLLQLLSGSIYDEEKNVHVVDCDNKVEALTDIIDQLPEDQPAIVFCSFVHIQKYLQEKLLKKYKTVELMNGDTSDKDRAEICARVLSKDVKVVIAHPQTTALGVDFTSTNVIIYFTPTQRNELYIQSQDRIRRLSSVGKEFTSFLLYHLISDPIEQRIYEGLQKKTMSQNELMHYIRAELIKELNIN